MILFAVWARLGQGVEDNLADAALRWCDEYRRWVFGQHYLKGATRLKRLRVGLRLPQA